MSSINELAEDRVVEGVYAVARKQRLRTKKGAAYLSLELVDPTGRIEARIWNDVELLDGRFAEGDAVRVLGRVSKFGDRLQLDVRSVEAADADPGELTPRLRRDADELDGFLEFLAAEISHAGLVAVVRRFTDDSQLRTALRTLPAAETPPLLRGRPARAHGRRRDASREKPRSSTPACAQICSSRPRLLHDSDELASWVGRRRSGRPRRGACSATSTWACD